MRITAGLVWHISWQNISVPGRQLKRKNACSSTCWFWPAWALWQMSCPSPGITCYLVTQGLRIINHDGWYPQLSSGLRAVLNLAQRPYDEDTIKFQIAPILNAAGRLYNAGSTSVLKALLSQDEAQAAGFAAKMQQINERRKTLVTQCLEQAQVAASYRADDPFDHLLRGHPRGHHWYPGRKTQRSLPEASLCLLPHCQPVRDFKRLWAELWRLRSFPASASCRALCRDGRWTYRSCRHLCGPGEL